MLLVFALALLTGAGAWRSLAAVLTAFALGYSGALAANAFGWIGTASEWGIIATGLVGFTLVMISLTRSKIERYGHPAVLIFLWLGALLGSAFGGDWSRAGLAYGDMPAAGIALFLGVWIGLMLLAGVPFLVRVLHRDFNAGRLPPLAVVPAYVLGIVGAFLILRSSLALAGAGTVQPYLRPEAMVAALAAGMLGGKAGGTRSLSMGALFLCASLAGLCAGTRGLDLPAGSTFIPLSLAFLGILFLTHRGHTPGLGAAAAVLSGIFLGWINGNWLAEHVSASLPSAVGGMVLLIGIVLAGALLRRYIKAGQGLTLDIVAGIGLIAGSFAMRFAGYRVSAFKEISVGAATGLQIPVLSLILLALALILSAIALRRTDSGIRAPRFALPWTFLLLAGLIVVPYGTYALGGHAASAAAMSDEDASELIAGLLSNTYRAVNLKGEEEIYDRLSMSVHGDLVETLYLESRKRSVIPSQADAEAKLIDVNVMEILERGPAEDGIGYSFTTRWQVAGTIRHWAHKHNRLNRYAGVLTVRAVDDLWKLTELELLDEERL
jgi:hypothetical protein